MFSSSVIAQEFNEYNRQFTYNQQYGSTNWYSSPLGMGVAQAGVTIIGGLVNAMSKPQQPQYIQQQPQYVNTNPRCSVQTVFDQMGNQRAVNICE
jgi:hypothetical protein